MLYFYLRNLRLIKLSGIFLPFVINTRFRCELKRGAKIFLSSRLHIGSKKLLSLSGIPANLQFGTKSESSFGSSISIGPGVNIIVKEGGKLAIGNNTYLTSDMHLEVAHNIAIGDNCAISWGTTIIDEDHHQIIYDNQRSSNSGVIIEDSVWIGCNCTILKGTTIGSGSVVAAGSVVKGSFPSNVLIAGNPARVIRENVRWQ